VRRKRILHLINTLSSGGAERQLVTYLRQESMQRYENIVVLLDVENVDSLSSENLLVPEIKEHGIQVFGLGLSGAGNWIRAVRKLRKRLKAEPVDLIHTNLLGPNVVGRLVGYFTGIPVLTTYHNQDYSPEATVFHFSGSRLKLKVMRQVDSFLAKRACPRVIAVSKCVADHIVNHIGYPSSQIRLINYPVDPRHMQIVEPNPKSWVRQNLGIGSETSILIDVCRLVYQKNLPRLLDAFQSVLKMYPNTHLVILGSTQNTLVYKEVCDRIIELGLSEKVHIPGPTIDVSSWLAGSDIFVFPSLVEGMPIALAESMSLGLPCISSHVGPIPEMIVNRENGLLVDPLSTQEITTAICELLSNPALSKQLGNAAKATADNLFDPYRQTQKLIAVYEEIFAETGRKSKPAKRL
jgi:glycosyltransferase involved in cell wall biosynthesis